MTIQTFSLLFAILALCALTGAAAVTVMALVRRAAPEGAVAYLLDDVGRVHLWIAWLVAAVAMGGSLYFSEVAGFTPCPLCWYQRICMYPLAVMLLVAAIRRDEGIRIYVGIQAAIGATISVYHSWLQAFPPESGSSFCTPDAPCTERHVWEFGFVSIPFMALCGFLAILAFTLLAAPRRTTEDPAEPLLSGQAG